MKNTVNIDIGRNVYIILWNREMQAHFSTLFKVTLWVGVVHVIGPGPGINGRLTS